jgi:hypothetical protein
MVLLTVGAPAACKQRIDDLADRHGLAVADEVRAAGTGGAWREVRQRIEMRLRGVVDVGGVDAVLAVADETQASGLGALDQSRQQLVVADAQIKRGRSATVAREASLAASTACSAIFLVAA